jgi:hypothetical protein
MQNQKVLGQLATGQVPLPVSALDVLYEKRHPVSSSVWGNHEPMRNMKDYFASRKKRGLALAFGLAFCLINVSSVGAQAVASGQTPAPTSRLLTVKEGRSIVNTAWDLGRPTDGTVDCSHLIHEIYQNAGFDYPYQNSFELYEGAEKFKRVRFPHSGDLIVWPGHVGIVVDPLQHSFYSLVRTGLEEQDYEAVYWRSRGTPRFYRYKKVRAVFQPGAKTPATAQVSNDKRSPHLDRAMEDRSSQERSASKLPPKTASTQNSLIYGPETPAELRDTAQAFELPPSIAITRGRKPPTREEVGEGIFELSDAEGGLLRIGDPLKVQMPVSIVEQFSVERVEIQRDHGWAHLKIHSKASIVGGTVQFKRVNEKVVWALRRTESSWEAVRPTDRAYVPRDVAVKNLSAQLARLAESNAAGNRREEVLRQELQLAQLLNVLLTNE